MSETTAHGWQVLDAKSGVWCYEYGFAGEGRANCLVARMPDGKLLVLSPAHHMSDAGFDDLGQLGEVGAVIATNGFHHLGVPAWRRRYPDARFFAPQNAAARIAKKNPDAGEFEPFSALAPMLGEEIVLREAPASKCGETWAILAASEGYIWFASDILANLPSLPSSLLPRLLFKWTKSAPGYRVFHLGLQFIIKDKPGLLREVLADVDRYPPALVVPAHGALVRGPEVVSKTRAALQAAL